MVVRTSRVESSVRMLRTGPTAALHNVLPHIHRYPNPSLSFWHTLLTSGSLKSNSLVHVLIIISSPPTSRELLDKLHQTVGTHMWACVLHSQNRKPDLAAYCSILHLYCNKYGQISYEWKLEVVLSFFVIAYKLEKIYSLPQSSAKSIYISLQAHIFQ